MAEIKAPRIKPMARVNTRIREDQQVYIKAVAKRTGKTEGEVFRSLIDQAIKN